MAGAEAASSTPERDPLASNGLSSPSCRADLQAEATLAARRACQTSGFAAAPAPTGDYGLDVHVDTGARPGTGWMQSVLQSTVVSPLWMALVWAVRALVVMLEWAFSLGLLAASTTQGLHLLDGERQMIGLWLAFAFAVAAAIAAYNGLVRRRIAATLAEACSMVALMVAAAGVAADPGGTVGLVSALADQASAGTLALAARGTPDRPGKTLGESMSAVYRDAVQAPWCYLEFGAVEWCRNPSRLDPALRRAGLRIAAREAAREPCKPAGRTCSGPQQASAELLREAHSNGDVFLALPANGLDRNSFEEGSLLRTICASPEATRCRGPDAAQAGFRTGAGTWSRLGGLVLIAGAMLGMLLVFGFVAARLLTAAVASLFYLLLTPAIVLAPAFGERGRTAFLVWAQRLLAAAVCKLVFAFLLGTMLGVMDVLSGLASLGWWTQWLLTASFWWSAYLHRHRLPGAFAGGAGPARRRVAMRLRVGGRRREALDTGRI